MVHKLHGLKLTTVNKQQQRPFINIECVRAPLYTFTALIFEIQTFKRDPQGKIITHSLTLGTMPFPTCFGGF